MRSQTILVVFLAILLACNPSKEEKPATVKGKTLEELPVDPEKLTGTYTGNFKGTPLSLTLNYVSHNHASGYNVHKGLTRNVSGTVAYTAQGLQLQLAEPGNNPYDGEFSLLIDTTTFTAKGNWKPFKKGEEATFTLKKQKALKEDEQYEIVFIDTLQNTLTLKPDGSCVYSYRGDTTATAQQLTVRGNYAKEGKTVTVYWQKNKAFPLQKSVFKLTQVKPDPAADYTEKTLTGEGKVFSELFY